MKAVPDESVSDTLTVVSMSCVSRSLGWARASRLKTRSSGRSNPTLSFFTIETGIAAGILSAWYWRFPPLRLESGLPCCDGSLFRGHCKTLPVAHRRFEVALVDLIATELLTDAPARQAAMQGAAV